MNVRHIVQVWQIEWSVSQQKPVPALCGDFRVRDLPDPDAPICDACATRWKSMMGETVEPPEDYSADVERVGSPREPS